MTNNQSNELREQIKNMKPAQTHESKEKYGEFTFGDFLADSQISQLVALIQEREQLARLSERNSVALDNYRGQTFSPHTNYKAKFNKFTHNNERRIEQLQEDKS